MGLAHKLLPLKARQLVSLLLEAGEQAGPTVEAFMITMDDIRVAASPVSQQAALASEVVRNILCD